MAFNAIDHSFWIRIYCLIIPKHIYNLRHNLQNMKTVFPITILMLLLLLTGQAVGSYWFQVVDVSPISLAPNSAANFTVDVKGLGSNGAYVQLVFKNMTEGLEVSCPKMIKYVFPAGVTEYNCSMKAGDIAPGNYSYVVDVAAKGSPSGKKTAYIEVVGMNGLATESSAAALGSAAANGANAENAEKSTSEQAKSETPDQAAPAPESQNKATPGFGAVLGALCLAMAFKRLKF
jgi:hypothetical protein